MGLGPDEKRVLNIESSLDVGATLAGAKDVRTDSNRNAWWMTRTPAGPGTLRLQLEGTDKIEAAAWGPGAAWLVEQAPRLLGIDDNPDTFSPPPKLARPWRAKRFRLARTDRPWDAVVRGILGQKVQKANAVKSRHQIARIWGDPAPGPMQGFVLPHPKTVAELGYYDLHNAGLERKRAETLLRVAKEMSRLDNITTSGKTCDQVQKRLSHIRGVGPWTVALVTAISMGDPDAVQVGDFHLPNTIGWHLASQVRSTDEQMLELLEPYRGRRQRVIRIAKTLGAAPKFGPKLSLDGSGLQMGS